MKTAVNTLFALPMLASALLHAAYLTINDRTALGDLKVGKAVFLVGIGEAKKSSSCLEVIQGTCKGIKDQGVAPGLVLVYIGPGVKYLTASPSAGTGQDAGGVLLEIEPNVESLAALGMRQEICAVAMRAPGIDSNTNLPGLTPVGDGFISLIGYQAQGYHLVPVFQDLSQKYCCSIKATGQSTADSSASQRR